MYLIIILLYMNIIILILTFVVVRVYYGNTRFPYIAQFIGKFYAMHYISNLLLLLIKIIIDEGCVRLLFLQKEN